MALPHATLHSVAAQCWLPRPLAVPIHLKVCSPASLPGPPSGPQARRHCQLLPPHAPWPAAMLTESLCLPLYPCALSVCTFACARLQAMRHLGHSSGTCPYSAGVSCTVIPPPSRTMCARKPGLPRGCALRLALPHPLYAAVHGAVMRRLFSGL